MSNFKHHKKWQFTLHFQITGIDLNKRGGGHPTDNLNINKRGGSNKRGEV